MSRTDMNRIASQWLASLAAGMAFVLGDLLDRAPALAAAARAGRLTGGPAH
jgi:hypothetical protein